MAAVGAPPAMQGNPSMAAPEKDLRTIDEWMADPEFREKLADAGVKIRVLYLILPAETYGEAKRLCAALERETGLSGITKNIRYLPDAPPRREDMVPCPFALATTSETLAKNSPELLARVRASVPHPRHVRLTRMVERCRSFVLHQTANGLELVLLLICKLKGVKR